MRQFLQLVNYRHSVNRPLNFTLFTQEETKNPQTESNSWKVTKLAKLQSISFNVLNFACFSHLNVTVVIAALLMSYLPLPKDFHPPWCELL